MNRHKDNGSFTTVFRRREALATTLKRNDRDPRSCARFLPWSCSLSSLASAAFIFPSPSEKFGVRIGIPKRMLWALRRRRTSLFANELSRPSRECSRNVHSEPGPVPAGVGSLTVRSHIRIDENISGRGFVAEDRFQHRN